MALPCFAHLLQVNNLPWECFNLLQFSWAMKSISIDSSLREMPKVRPIGSDVCRDSEWFLKNLPHLAPSMWKPMTWWNPVRASLANPKKMCQVGWKDLQTVFSLPLVYDHLTTQTRRTKQSNRTNAELCRTQQHMKHIEWIRAESCRPSWRTSSKGGRLFLSIGLRNSKI